MVNVHPPIAGPAARPKALMLTAMPFKVPRMRRLVALLVRRMVVHGKAKMTAQHFMSMTAKMPHCCANGVGRRAVKGVMM